MTSPHEERRERSALESILDRFEKAWRSGAPPRIEDFLSAAVGSRLTLLRELVQTDLELRLQKGQEVRVEQYLSRFPELQSQATDLVELVAAEHRFRRRRGENPATEEYVRRFPQLENELAARLNRPSAHTEMLSPVTAAAPAALPDRVGRYRIGEEIARGGMGRVLRVHDESLHRPLAMKVLLGAGHNALAERFLKEAALTGRLQHPGIPPVHELGELPDGRPFFVMKLIQGRSLRELLRERSSAAQDLPRFLAIFEQVGQTLAYAHSEGIIHRDLKPANIMVGAFGEVQVMDWGLAKSGVRGQGSEVSGQEPASQPIPDPCLLSPESAAAPVGQCVTSPQEQPSGEPETVASRAPAPGSTAATAAGMVLGTPGYMAPEQARGEVDQLDARADVFGLGAILCEILTSQPAFVGPDVQAMQQQAIAADVSDALARLDACGADGELVRLARRCLAPCKEERPRHGGEVAEAVQQYQALVEERWRRAELERAEANVQAQEQRKRAEVEQARADEERRRRQVERQKRWVQLALAVVVLGVVLAGSGVVLWHQQDQAARDAEAAAQQAAQEQRHALREQAIAEALDRARQLRAALLTRLDRPGGVFELLNKPAQWSQYLEGARSALQRVKDLNAAAEEPVAEKLQRGLRHLEELLEQDETDQWLALRLEQIREDRAITVKGQFNPAGTRHSYEAAFQGAGMVLRPGREAEAADWIRRSPIKDQLLAALDEWAYLAWMQKDTAVQERLLRVARLADPDPWRRQVRDADTWKSGRRLQELAGKALADNKKLSRLSPQMLNLLGLLVEAAEGDAEEVLRQAQVHYPTDFWINFDLGRALDKNKRPQQAEAFYRAALAIRPTSGAAWNNLAIVLNAQKHKKGAIQAYYKALEIDSELAQTWNNLGYALRDRKDHDGAIKAFRKALQINARLPSAWDGLGAVLFAQHMLADAIKAFRTALKIDPRHPKAWGNLGAALAQDGNQQEAVKAFHQSLAIDSAQPMVWTNLGLTLHQQRDVAGAVAAHRKALELDPKHAIAWTNLGTALAEQKDFPQAAEALRKGLELDPDYGPAWANLGAVLHQQKDFAGAERAYRKVLELNPRAVQTWYNLALAQRLQGQFAEANKTTLQALKLLKPQHPLYQRVQGHLRLCEQLLAQQLRLQEVLQGAAATPAEQLTLADFCRRYLKRYADAARLYAGAFAAQPVGTIQAGQRYTAACCAVLAASGQSQGADLLEAKEKKHLRRQGLQWLRTELAVLAQRMVPPQTGTGAAEGPGVLGQLAQRSAAPGAAEVLMVVEKLAQWQADSDLQSVRGEQELVKLPEEEQKDWRRFWIDVRVLAKQARAAFSQSRLTGSLTSDKRAQVQTLSLSAGRTYIFDLQSKQFDAFLRLENDRGMMLAEDDDGAGEQNARLVFTPPQDGNYCLILTSFRQLGTGDYTLIIREFPPRKR
jgi:serine/threonine protein kinase/Flp pilus assembly protein TadD